MNKSPETYALVSQYFDRDWKARYNWADSVSRKWHGNFDTPEKAIEAVPSDIRKIRVQYHGVDYTIDRETTV